MNIDVLVEKYGVDRERAVIAQDKVDSKEVHFYGVSGQMGSGKDTACDIVNELFNNKFKHHSFATPLREEMNEVKQYALENGAINATEKFNVTEYEVSTLLRYMGDDNSYDRTPGMRLAIQFWGTDVRRKQNSDYWVAKTAQYVIDELSKGNSIYITDARFPNEANSIDELGGALIRIHVSEQVRAERIAHRDGFAPNVEQLRHVSETSLNDYTFRYIVDGTQTPITIAQDIVSIIK